MLTVDNFKILLKSGATPEKIFQEHVISNEVWLLEKNFGPERFTKYDKLKTIIAAKLKIQPSQVYVVGSAKFGFSHSPRKNFRIFDLQKSDIDVVIVAPKLFRKYWDLLLENYYTNGRYVDERHMENAFKRFVNIKKKELPSLSNAFQKLMNQFGELQSELFVELTISNELNFRIYEDWDAVEKYHTKGLEDLRKKI